MTLSKDQFTTNMLGPKKGANIGVVSDYAHQVVDIDKEINELTQAIALLQERRAILVEQILPALMEEYQLQDFTMKDGSLVELTEKYFCGITKERAPRAIGWLEENGHGGLVRTKVQVPFGKGGVDKARRFAQKLSGDHPGTSMSYDVHFKTLEAWVKEMYRSGKAFPYELFGFQVKPVVVVKTNSGE